MAALDEFYPLLLMEVLSCPNPVVDHHLRIVAREFCRTTSAWGVAFDPITLTAGQATYELDPPVADAAVLRLTQMMANGILLWTFADVDPASSARVTYPKYQPQHPPFSLSPDLKEITLIADEVPGASVSGGLLLSGALQPTMTANSLPDFLLNVYGEMMRMGTLARLMAMGEKAWTDRQLSAEYQRQYSQMLGFAAYQASVGNTRERLRVRSWG